MQLTSSLITKIYLIIHNSRGFERCCNKRNINYTKCKKNDLLVIIVFICIDCSNYNLEGTFTDDVKLIRYIKYDLAG